MKYDKTNETIEYYNIIKERKKHQKKRKYDNFAEICEMLIEQGISMEYIDIQKKYVINTSKYGKLGYFPAKDKLHFQKSNSWKENGLSWIKNHISELKIS